jgi:hypothetical protein
MQLAHFLLPIKHVLHEAPDLLAKQISILVSSLMRHVLLFSCDHAFDWMQQMAWPQGKQVRHAAQTIQLQGSGHIHSLASVVGLVGPTELCDIPRQQAICNGNHPLSLILRRFWHSENVSVQENGHGLEGGSQAVDEQAKVVLIRWSWPTVHL